MSGTFLIFGQKSRWFHCCTSYFYKNAVKNVYIHSAARYCIYVKDKDRDYSQIKNFKHKNIADKNILNENIALDEVIKDDINGLEDKSNKLTSQRFNKESLILKRVERLYPDAKSSLISIYTIVGHELNDKKILSSNIKFTNRSRVWDVTFNVKWPEVTSFNGIGKTKTVAYKNAALKCLQWLEMNGKLKNGKPIIYDTENLKSMQSPIKLSVTPEILHNMTNLIETYNKEIQNLTVWEDAFNTPSFNNMIRKTIADHPVVGKATYTEARNAILRQRLLDRSTDKIDLPIFKFKNEILSKLENNRVLLIEGDTGCGKTTQVPQFIMDSFAQNGNAADCNILVSQPRRISAISLADRIAHERNERVGDVVGFQVRLEQVLPKEHGGILFCTTGILLKKLQSNPNLVGCSHVILDEAHERHIDTDMLMILLKRALKQNSHLKVLIMSATINAHLIQQYFNCPAVKVPGRLYPVRMHFLEDIERLPKIHKYSCYNPYKRQDDESERITLDCGKIVQVVRWIAQHKPPGAILCFLPGWNEIATVQSMLEESFFDSENLILPIHSKVSHAEQRRIFQQTPANTRKIILATDIAETGITVTDVVYVVDSAIRKESRWDDHKDLPYVGNRWVSQANIHQRKGRAGRVKPGESYHLITKTEYEKLEPHPMPQVLCNPLEKVILDSKSYTNEKAIDFMGGLLQPPSSMMIKKAVKYLVDLGVLDHEENLTALGKRMMSMSTHPKFSKALVYSSIFNCIHPVITIASVFSGEENLFYGILDHKLEIRENKKLYHPSSDHLAIAWIYKQWFAHSITDSQSVFKFCKQMRLRLNRLQTLKQIRNTFIQQLTQNHLLANTDIANYENFDIAPNKYENNDELIRALIYSATQQFVEHKNMGFKNGILRTGVNELRTQNHAKVVISGESVNYKRKVWPSPYLTYFNSAHCEMRRGTVIRETSVISPLTVLLFSQGNVQCYKQDDGRIEIVVNVNNKSHLSFSCDKNTANVLLDFKDIMWSLVQYSLKKQGLFTHDDNIETQKILDYKDRLLETLSETLFMSSESIEDVKESK